MCWRGETRRAASWRFVKGRIVYLDEEVEEQYARGLKAGAPGGSQKCVGEVPPLSW